MSARIENQELTGHWLNGVHRIFGVAKRLGVPIGRTIQLYSRLTGALVRQVQSDSSGNYAFNNLEYLEKGYFVVELENTDESPPKKSDIADLVTPEPMP